MIIIEIFNNRLLQISADDNVAVVLKSDKKNIPPGHKVAIQAIGKGDLIYKYGYPIGRAIGNIASGEWVHEHNMITCLEGEKEFEYRPNLSRKTTLSWVPSINETFFKGYQRPDGKVGVRNQIWIINTVGCCNGTAQELAMRGKDICRQAGLEGPFHFNHVHGCSQLGEDLANTQRILAGLVHHPNAGGVLVLGLGCENNHLGIFRDKVGEHHPERIRWLNIQDCEDEISAGLELIKLLVGYAGNFRRERIPVNKLVVGLKCGGSDAFSGITANPLVGQFTDVLIQAGGSAILTEVPEMFGAEEIILNRCVSYSVFQKAVDMINSFKRYFTEHGQPVYENPSPGNRQGGITTLEEKSLGCVLKGGNGPITDVLEYGKRVDKNGISLMNGPGNDLISVTALAASGAQIILFTTGRGTPFGGPVPTIKIASNSSLAMLKKRWFDFNAGCLLEDCLVDEVTKRLYLLVLDIASGYREARNEEYGFREIALFKNGVTL